MTATPASGPSGAPSPARSPGIAAIGDGPGSGAVSAIRISVCDGPVALPAGATRRAAAEIPPPSPTDVASQPEGATR